MTYQIQSNDDDTVTITVSGLTINVRGSDWRHANDAAHSIGRMFGLHRDIERLRLSMIGLGSCVTDIETAFREISGRVEDAAAYAGELPKRVDA